MALDATQFVTRTALDNLSIRYANDASDYIAEALFPTQVVNKYSFKVYQYDTSNFREETTATASDAEARKIDYGVFSTDRSTTLHKLAADIDPRTAKSADAAVANLKMDATLAIMDKLLISRERLAATKATTSTNYPSDLTSALVDSSTRWTDSGGDPEADSITARNAVRARCRKAPNALALSWLGLERLKTSPAMLDRVKYTDAKSVSVDLIKNVMQVQYLFVGAAAYNGNLEGNATQTLTDIWSDNAIFFVYEPNPALRSVCYGKTYMHNQLYSHEYLDDRRGSGAGRIEVIERGWEYVQEAGAVVSSSDTDFAAGYLLRNVY